MRNNPLDSLSPKNLRLVIFISIGVYFIYELITNVQDFSQPAFFSALWVLSLFLTGKLIKGKINIETILITPGYFGILYFSYYWILEWYFLFFKSIINQRLNLGDSSLDGYMLLKYGNRYDSIEIIYIVILDFIGKILHRHFVKNGSIKIQPGDIATETSSILLIEALLAFFFMVVISTIYSVISKFFL